MWSALEDSRVTCWKNNRKWGKPHSGASLDLFKVKHELSGARFLFCDKASDDVKHGRGGLWIGEGRGWKLCDKPFSHPLYFRGQQPSPLPEDAVWSERACTFSAAALSLQKFSPWTVCLQAAQHWLYCKNQRLEAEVWNTQLKQDLCLSLWGWRFLCSRLSSSGSDFNSAQRLKEKNRCTCVAVSITGVSNAPLPHLPPLILRLDWVSRSCERWECGSDL